MAEEVKRPMGAILHDVAEDITGIIRSEIKLAKAEFSTQAARIKQALPMLISGSIFGLYALGLLLTAGVLTIGLVLPYWAAAAIVFGFPPFCFWQERECSTEFMDPRGPSRL